MRRNVLTRDRTWVVILAMVENPRNSNLERLKICILYALRFETDTSGIRELKGLLEQKGVPPEQVVNRLYKQFQ